LGPFLSTFRSVSIRVHRLGSLRVSKLIDTSLIPSEKSTKILTENGSRSVVSGRLEGLLYEFGGLLFGEFRLVRPRDVFVTEFVVLEILRLFNLFKFHALHSFSLEVAALSLSYF
jgi:hypothetical protein